MIAVIGNGLVGKQVTQIVNPNHIFDSSNIQDLRKNEWDTIYCAAPSGNRIWTQKNPNEDKRNVYQIISKCTDIKFRRFVLLSTGDTQIKPDSIYGSNRLQLENWVKNLPVSSIIRLPSLIHVSITKNILYDIKHNCWLDKINPNNKLQWFNLNLLEKWINTTECEVNVCSEPIQVHDIIKEFAPQILHKLDYALNGDIYDLKPYSYTREEIFTNMKDYLK